MAAVVSKTKQKITHLTVVSERCDGGDAVAITSEKNQNHPQLTFAGKRR